MGIQLEQGRSQQVGGGAKKLLYAFEFAREVVERTLIGRCCQAVPAARIAPRSGVGRIRDSSGDQPETIACLLQNAVLCARCQRGETLYPSA